MTTLIIDNGSPYVSNIVYFLDLLGEPSERKKPSDFYSINDLKNYKRAILSGRQKNSAHVNKVNSKIVNECLLNNIPLLGICYGAQIIALTCGGTIKRLNEHIKGKSKININIQNPLVTDETSIYVFQSHSYCISRLPPELVTVSSSLSCDNEIIVHHKKRIFGLQFHPEMSGQTGLKIIKNFINLEYGNE